MHHLPNIRSLSTTNMRNTGQGGDDDDDNYCWSLASTFQLYWDRLTLLLLPKADDQIYGGENDGKERWSITR